MRVRVRSRARARVRVRVRNRVRDRVTHRVRLRLVTAWAAPAGTKRSSPGPRVTSHRSR